MTANQTHFQFVEEHFFDASVGPAPSGGGLLADADFVTRPAENYERVVAELKYDDVIYAQIYFDQRHACCHNTLADRQALLRLAAERKPLPAGYRYVRLGDSTEILVKSRIEGIRDAFTTSWNWLSATPERTGHWLFQKCEQLVNYLTEAGMSGVAYVCKKITKGLLKYVLAPAYIAVFNCIEGKLFELVLVVTVLLLAFFAGLTATTSAFGGIAFALLSGIFIGVFAVGTGIMETFIQDVRALVEQLDQPGYGLQGQAPGDSESRFSFSWFQALMSSMGITFIYSVTTLSKAWSNIRNLQDFGAFIFDMLPTFIQEIVYQAFPKNAVFMLFRNCGWSNYMTRLESIANNFERMASPELHTQFQSTVKDAERFLSIHGQAPWFPHATTQLKVLKDRVASLNISMKIYEGEKPFLIQIGGKHNLAKTEMAMNICDLIASLDAGFYRPGAFYDAPNVDHWDSYAGQRIILFKDFLGHSEETRTADVDNWVGISEGAFQPNFDKLEHKGRVLHIDAAVGATNFPFPETVPNQNNLKAFLRRRHLVIMVSPAPAHAAAFDTVRWESTLKNATEEEKKNFSLFTYQFVDPIDKTRTGEVPYLPGTFYRQDMNADVLLDRITVAYTNYRAARLSNKRDFTSIVSQRFASCPKPTLGVPEEVTTSDGKKIWVTPETLQSFMSLLLKGALAYKALTFLLDIARTKKKTSPDDYVEIEQGHSVSPSRTRLRARPKNSRIVEAHAPDQLMDQLNALPNNTVYISREGRGELHATMLDSNTFVTVAHFFRIGPDFVECPFTLRTEEGVVFELYFNPKQSCARVFRCAGKTYVNDAVVVRINKIVPRVRKITNMVQDAYPIPSEVYLVSDGKYRIAKVEGRSGTVPYTDDRCFMTHVVADRPLKYDYRGYKGACGIPVYGMVHGALKLLGIHCGASFEIGYAVSLLKKDLPKEQGVYFEDIETAHGMDVADFTNPGSCPPGNAVACASLPTPIITSMKTQLARTDFPDPKDGGISEKSVKILFDREARFHRPQVLEFPPAMHEYAQAVTVDLYTRHADEYPAELRTVMTAQEAVDSLDPDNSVGFPWKQKRSELCPHSSENKEWDPEFKRVFDKLHAELREGRFRPAVIKPNLKDEWLKHQKLVDKKTRTFEISSMEWMIIGKMYTGRWLDYMTRNNMRLPSAIGMDPWSVDFHHMVKKMEDFSSFFFDADYETFEALLTHPMANVYLRCMDVFYNDEGSVNQHVRRAYIYAMFAPAVVAGRSVWQRFTSNPSGMVGTCQINSVANTYILAASYKDTFPDALVGHFEMDVCHKNCGDDLFGSIKETAVDKYNLNTIIDFAARYRIGMTNGLKTKDRIPYMKRQDCIFLQCRPLYSEDLKCYVAYMPDQRIKNQLAYCRDVTAEGHRALALSVLHQVAVHGITRSPEMPADHMSYLDWGKYIKAVLPNLDVPSWQRVYTDFHRYDAEFEDHEFDILDEFDDDCIVEGHSRDQATSTEESWESERHIDLVHKFFPLGCTNITSVLWNQYARDHDEHLAICNRRFTDEDWADWRQFTDLRVHSWLNVMDYVDRILIEFWRQEFHDEVVRFRDPPIRIGHGLGDGEFVNWMRMPKVCTQTLTPLRDAFIAEFLENFWTKKQALPSSQRSRWIEHEEIVEDIEHPPPITMGLGVTSLFYLRSAAKDFVQMWTQRQLVVRHLRSQIPATFKDMTDDQVYEWLLVRTRAMVANHGVWVDVEDPPIQEGHGNVQTIVDNRKMTAGGNIMANTTANPSTTNDISAAAGGAQASKGPMASSGGLAGKLGSFFGKGARGFASALVNDHAVAKPSGKVEAITMDEIVPEPSAPDAPELEANVHRDVGWDQFPPLENASMDQPNHTLVNINTDAPVIMRTALAGVDTLDNLGDLPAHIDLVTPSDFFAIEDEMAISAFTSQVTQIDHFGIPYTGGSGSLLAQYPMDPFQVFPQTISATTGLSSAVFLPKLEAWASQFGFWRGPLKFHFHLFAPREYTARLAFCLGYNDYSTTAPSYETAITGVTVIKEFDALNRTCDIAVPYVTARDWLVPFFRNSFFPTNTTVQGRDQFCSLGTLRIYLSTNPAGPAASYTQNAQMFVYLSAPGMEFKRYLGVAGVQPTDLLPSMDAPIREGHSQGTTLVTPARVQTLAHSKMPTVLPPINLKRFAEKFATKEVFTVTTSSQPVKVYNFPQETLLAQALYAQSAMRYYRHDLVVRVTPLGSGWIGGAYTLTFLPYANADSTVLTNLGDIVKTTSCPYVMVDLASNQPVELVIPYRYHKEFFTVGDTTEYYGSVVLTPGSSVLQAPSVGTMSVDLEVQFGVRDFQSFVPAEIGNDVLTTDAPIREAHSDDAKEDVVAAPLTSDEKKKMRAVAPIAELRFMVDPRIITHLSDLLKRPYVRQLINCGNDTGLIASVLPLLQPLGGAWPPGAWSWLLFCFKAWKGDLVYCFEQTLPNNQDEFAIILVPQTEGTGATAPQTALDYYFKLTEASPSGVSIPDDLLPGGGGNNNWGDASPIIISDATRFRVNVPYHSINKFTVYDPLSQTGLPLYDTTPLAQVSIFRTSREGTVPIQILRWIVQTADSYRLSHYNPERMNLAGVLITGPGVINFPGQYFKIA